MTFYEEMQGVATELLTEFNQGIIRLVRITKTGPSYNQSQSSQTIYPLHGVTKGVSQKYVDGKNIVITDSQAIISVPSDIIPDISDKLRVDGKDYEILSVKKIPESGITVAILIIYRT